jgi:hypothetical protein
MFIAARTSINQQILPRIPPTRPRTQKQNCPLQLLRESDPAKQRLLLKLLDEIWFLDLQSSHHIRHHVAWRQGVHANSVLSKLIGERFDEAAHGGFGGAVAGDGLHGGGDVCCDRADEYDVAGCGFLTGSWFTLFLATSDHGIGTGLGDEEGAGELCRCKVRKCILHDFWSLEGDSYVDCECSLDVSV